jgi:hypothetical protein
MNVGGDIERRFLPQLELLAADLRASFPHWQIHVSSHPTGRLTPFQGHDLSIECLNPRASGEPDNVALTIALCHLDRNPKLMADVCWGHPSGHVEASLHHDWTTSSDWPAVTNESIDALDRALPRLFDALRTALDRERPPQRAR